MFSQSSFVVALAPLNGKISIRTALQSELDAMSSGDMSRQTSHAQTHQCNGPLFPGKEDHRGGYHGYRFLWKLASQERIYRQQGKLETSGKSLIFNELSQMSHEFRNMGDCGG
jgi:hypothetical protein